jgi:hypothetical protein
MAIETTPPGDGAPEPDALRVPAESDTPLPLRTEANAAIGLGWHQPLSQPRPQTSTHLPQGGLVEPPFAPPVHVEARLTGVEATAEAGTPSVIVNRTIAAESGHYKIEGNAAGLVVKRVIGRAVATNRVAIQLAAVSLLNALNAKLEALHDERSNSEDAAPYQNLKRLVEEFLAAQAKNEEEPIVESALSLAAGIRQWWTQDHISICNKALNISLFTGGLAICGLAGALGPVSVVTVGALVGGKDVASALESCVKLLMGRD